MLKRIKSVFLAVIVFSITIGGMRIEANAEDKYNRIWGKDKYDTAVEISKAGWQSGSRNVVLAYGEDYPDALCAAPLAKQLDAPILLTGGKKLEKAVSDEINRLGAGNVFVIGGVSVVSSDIEKSIKSMGLECVRLNGDNRYETSTAVANYMAENFGMANEAVIATGDDFPDALTIAPVAGIKSIPILLTSKKELPESVKEFIDKGEITTAYIAGGENVISKDVENRFSDPIRLGGDNRYETNIAILKYFMDDINLDSIYLATGNNFPDALSGSALAAANNAPILLLGKTPDNSVSEFVSDNRLMIKNIIAIGGEAVVSNSAIEPLLPKIVSIDDISDYVNEDADYELPSSVKAELDNGTTRDVAVVWDSDSVDTGSGPVLTYEGTVKGYSDKVVLTLNVMHPIMGKSKLTAKQMAEYLLYKNPDPQIACTALELAQIFLEEGEAEGVRGDIAFAQSCKETGYFKYGGQVLPEQNNYAGIGATNGSPVGYGAWFKDPREGVRAQIQHLKAYASKEPLNQECVDPRFDKLADFRGIAPYWEWLGRDENPNNAERAPEDRKGWAVPGEDYGHTIISLYYEKIRKNIK